MLFVGKIKNKFNNCKLRIECLFILIPLLVGGFFIGQKEGYHMDELLSFELADAEFTPWIVPTQPVGRLEKFVREEIHGESFGESFSNLMEAGLDVLKNRGASKLLSYQADIYEEPVWISAQEFKDYITVDGSDCFNFLSVYFNVKDDNHPPLHFMAVHLMSSIWQEQIAPWMGCLINVFLLVGTSLLLLAIGRKHFGLSALEGGLCVLLYGCSMAGLSTLLLIRMYAMLTFFCLAALYLHLEKYTSGEWKKGNKRLILVTVLGFLTQYYFVIFMAFLAGTILVCLCKKGEKKAAFYYVRSMAVSACIGLCLFPFSIMDVLYSERGVESVSNITGLSGIGERFLAFLEILYEEVLGGAVGCICLVVLLGLLVYTLVVKKMPVLLGRGKKRFLLVPLLGYFLVVCKIAPYYADRYMMPIFPLLALAFSLLLGIVARMLMREEKTMFCLLCTGVVFLMLVPALLCRTPNYLYKGYAKQLALAKENADKDCLLVYDGVGYYQNLPELAYYKRTLLVKPNELLQRSFDSNLEENRELVVLLEGSVEKTQGQEIFDYLQNTYGLACRDLLLADSVHGDMIYLLTKK